MKNFMKKFGTLFISLALVLVMVPVAAIFAGCGEKEPEIKIFAEFKTEYYIGEDLDVSAGIIEYIDKNGKSTYVPVEKEMIIGYSKDTVGTRNMILTYEECQLVVPYTVSYCDITESSVYSSYNSAINVTDYIYFEKNSTGFKVYSAHSGDIGTNHQGVDDLIQKIKNRHAELQGNVDYVLANRTIQNNKVVYTVKLVGSNDADSHVYITVNNRTTIAFLQADHTNIATVFTKVQ